MPADTATTLAPIIRMEGLNLAMLVSQDVILYRHSGAAILPHHFSCAVNNQVN
jgi:hypothetical protein